MRQKEQMHVLMTTDTLSGVWPYTRELVTALAQRGVRVTLVSFGEIPSHEQTEWMDGLPGIDFRPTGFRLEWMRDSQADLKAAIELVASVIAETQPDLLHFNQFCFGALDTRLPKIVTAHGDVLSWWQSVHGSGPTRDDDWVMWYRSMVEEGIRRADALVAPSRWMLAALQGLYGRARMASVIYPGCPPAQFNPHMTKEMIAISVGRIWDFGRNSVLLSRFESPIPLFLLGPDAQPTHPANQAVFTPRQRLHLKAIHSDKQLRLLYAKSAIYVTTSRYEPFAMNTVEAAFSRCAIVASDIPSHREIWGDAAVYFRNDDAESLEQVLEELSAAPDLCATYGKLAYDRARERFTSGRMAEDWMALYQGTISFQAVAA
jgi:glycogen synthase